jgi:hypothetical protein
MKDQVRQNPTVNESFTVASGGITFEATGASGTITSSGSGVSGLTRGQAFIYSGATSGGFTHLAEYFTIPVNASGIRAAATFADALNGSGITNSGVMSGKIYPIYSIGGTLFIGTSGNINIRGMEQRTTGMNSFSLHSNIPNATLVPMMLKDICASGTTATGLVKWTH